MEKGYWKMKTIQPQEMVFADDMVIVDETEKNCKIMWVNTKRK